MGQKTGASHCQAYKALISSSREGDLLYLEETFKVT